MAWTAPRTWVTGEVVTAALMNTHVRDNLRDRRGLDGDVTFDDDIAIGANFLKTTNLILKETNTDRLAIRNANDDAFRKIAALDLIMDRDIIFNTSGAEIAGPGASASYILLKAQDTGVGRVEIARLQGAADPYFQMTLPQVLTPGTAPGTLVEGHFWYLAAGDKLYYRNASATEEIVSTASGTRGDIMYRAASAFARLPKGSAGQVLTQGADDPTWAGQNTIVFNTAGLFNATSPTTFTDLNLSGTVGSNQAVCLIKVNNNSGDATTQTYSFRKDDDTDNFFRGVGASISPVTDGDSAYLLIITDGTGVVEWQSNVAKTTVITMEAYLI